MEKTLQRILEIELGEMFELSVLSEREKEVFLLGMEDLMSNTGVSLNQAIKFTYEFVQPYKVKGMSLEQFLELWLEETHLENGAYFKAAIV